MLTRLSAPEAAKDIVPGDNGAYPVTPSNI